jgi:uncharacterized membrane protein YebE (DUF533 family)
VDCSINCSNPARICCRTRLAERRDKPAAGGLGGLLGGASGSGGLGSLLSGAGGGALAAGAMGLLLGNKKVRKVGGKVAIYGGLAALGVLAYKAYGNYNAQKGTAPQSEPQTLDRLPPAQAEQHSQAILKALVAAAKADGHIDDRERQLIEGEFTKLDNDQELQHWLHAELNKPLDPTDVARAASTPEMAAEMYIASVMLVDEENFMEKSYLDELARQLKLEPGLKVELEKQVRLASVCELQQSQIELLAKAPGRRHLTVPPLREQARSHRVLRSNGERACSRRHSPPHSDGNDHSIAPFCHYPTGTPDPNWRTVPPQSLPANPAGQA